MSLTQSVISKIQEFIEDRTSQNHCFSSGEIVAKIRTKHPSLVFSSSQVGRLISQMFNNFEIQYQYGAAERVLRTTTGVGRTPAGVEVYVYGPSEFEAQNYNFEVDVPNPFPQTQISLADGRTIAAPVQSLSPVQKNPSSTPVDSGFVAVVHKDGRLCIPPQAFEALARANGTTLNAGDFVYIGLVNGDLVISISGAFGTPSFVLTNEGRRVRVAATSPKLGLNTHFHPGTYYPLMWDSNNNLMIHI